MSGGVVRNLCVVCASQVIGDLLDTALSLQCVDAHHKRVRCDKCGKEKNCLTYEVCKRKEAAR